MGRPTQHNYPPLFFGQPGWGRGGGARRPVSAMRYPNPTPAPGRAGSGPASVAAAIAAGTRPDFPFPNPEAKTASADGTAPARVWESRTPPPTQTHKRRGARTAGPSFRLPQPRPHTRRHTTHRPTRTQQAAYRQGHTTHDTRATAANRASPHSRPHTVKATQPQPHSTTHRRQPNRACTNRPAHTPTPHPHTHKTQANEAGHMTCV